MATLNFKFLTVEIYTPASLIEFNGSGQLQKSDYQVIGYKVQIGGTNDTQVDYNANNHFQINIPPQIELAQ